VLVSGGFTIYKRPDNGRFIMVQVQMLTNQHVVPYNAYLLLKLNCHANVEAINKLSTIAYALDYILKGSDRAKVIMTAYQKQLKVRKAHF
jgi:hypothetical protein